MIVQRQDLIDAVELLDELSGTAQVWRPVERELVRRHHDEYDVPLDRVIPFDGRAQFRKDVIDLALMLEPDGTYYCADTFLYSSRRIADEMIASGISWATSRKVKEAQRILALALYLIIKRNGWLNG